MKLLSRVLASCSAESVPGLRDAVAFDVSNVAEYFYSGTDQEFWDETKDFPNLAPPFENAWFEYRGPKLIRSKDYGETHIQAQDRGWVGVWVRSELEVESNQAENVDLERLRKILAATVGLGGSGAEQARVMLEAINTFGRTDAGQEALKVEINRLYAKVVPVAKWRSTIALYAMYPDGSARGLRVPGEAIVVWQLRLDEHGRPVGLADGSSPLVGGPTGATVDAHGMQDEAYWFSFVKNCQSILYPILLGISFLHCKNTVVKVERESSVCQRVPSLRGPGVKFHTLEIKTMQEVLRTVGKSGETGIKQALHICRGHFRTYGAPLGVDEHGPVLGPGMFGRDSLRGTFWTPQHVRGTKDCGLVVKDYRVDGPAS